MKILLLGANGQVGIECRRTLAPLGELVIGTREGESGVVADLSQVGALRDLILSIAPDVVVNAAAYTAVDNAEVDRDIAFAINGEAPGIIAQACADSGAYLIHYSTDYVFDGQGNAPYQASDSASPLGAYGESKLAGEEAIRQSGCEYAILRTAWVYAAHGKNFLQTMLRLANDRDELHVVGDQIGTPTPAGLIADVTASIVAAQGRSSGIWHLTPHGQTSWYGFSEAIVDGAYARGLLAKRPIVTAITTDEYPTPARRPAWSVLDNSSLERDWGVALPDWQAGLEQVLDTLKSRIQIDGE